MIFYKTLYDYRKYKDRQELKNCLRMNKQDLCCKFCIIIVKSFWVALNQKGSFVSEKKN